MTWSTKPLATALSRLFWSASYSLAILSDSLESASGAMIFAAVPASMIPVMASGKARVRSAPADLAFMTAYALPTAFPVITFTFGIVAPDSAAINFAAASAIFFSSSFVLEKPLTFVKVMTGMSNASQKRTKSAALYSPPEVSLSS